MLVTLTVANTSYLTGSTHLVAPVTRLAGLMMFILQSGMLQSNSNEVLCVIILFIDQTFMADNDHQGSECPLFTLSILPRHICNQPWAWHPLGFIPKFESHQACGQNMEALHLAGSHLHSFWPTWHPTNWRSYHHCSPSTILPNNSYFQGPHCLHCWCC